MCALFVFFLTFYYWKKAKMGFGDVKLLTSLTLLFGIDIFFIIIISAILVIIINFKTNPKKIPLGFYTMLGTVIFCSIRGLYYVL